MTPEQAGRTSVLLDEGRLRIGKPESRMRRVPFRNDTPVLFTFDVDGPTNWIARDEANWERPVLLSGGYYGLERGLERIVDRLACHGVLATFFVPGWIVTQIPGVIRDLHERGHEIALHGWLHEHLDHLRSRDEERDLLQRGIDVMEDVLGGPPRGFRSAGEVTQHTVELLALLGFEYESEFKDDDWPYRHVDEHGSLGLIELPWRFDTDDAPYCLFNLHVVGRQFMPNSYIAEIWEAELDGATAEECAYAMFVMHPQYTGRLGRISLLEQMLSVVDQKPDLEAVRCLDLVREFANVQV